MAEKDKKIIPKPNRKPKPWYLGWGLAKFAAEKVTARQKEMKKKMEQAHK
ncbi:MAG: hypothetical protein KAR06_03860 [Deltaproteobacteria bacterium]|nr:hypothetical protein [Deltaproteobacteria bacterium]